MRLPTISQSTNFRMPEGYAERQLSTFKNCQLGLEFNDVVFMCGDGQEVRAHAVVLKAVSGLMASLLADYSVPKTGPATVSAFVYLPDFSLNCVQTFVEMLYFGKTRNGSKDLFVQVSDLMEMLGTKAVALENQSSSPDIQGSDAIISIVSGQDIAETDSNHTGFKHRDVNSASTCAPNERNKMVINLESSYSSETSNSSDADTAIDIALQNKIDASNVNANCDYELVLNDEQLQIQGDIQGSLSTRRSRIQHINKMNVVDGKSDETDSNQLADPEESEVEDVENNFCTSTADSISRTGHLNINQLNRRKRKQVMNSTENIEGISKPNKLSEQSGHPVSLTTSNEALAFLQPITLNTSKHDPIIKLRRIDDQYNTELMPSFNSSNCSEKQEDFTDSPLQSASLQRCWKPTTGFPDSLACPLCPRTFSTILNLQNHCAGHFRDRIRTDYLMEGDTSSCPKCDYKSGSSQSLIRHIANAHRVIIEYFQEMGIASDLFTKEEAMNVKRRMNKNNSF